MTVKGNFPYSPIVYTTGFLASVDPVHYLAGSRPPGRCWRCKESYFIAECARCSGVGHEESTRSSDAAVVAMELPMSEEDLAVEAQAFVAEETGKCSVIVGEEVGGRELGKQLVQYIADGAATCNMTPVSSNRVG